jgi:hypothetical protein
MFSRMIQLEWSKSNIGMLLTESHSLGTHSGWFGGNGQDFVMVRMNQVQIDSLLD